MKVRVFAAIGICILIERCIIQPLREHKIDHRGHYRIYTDQSIIALRPGKDASAKYAKVAPPPVDTKLK